MPYENTIFLDLQYEIVPTLSFFSDQTLQYSADKQHFKPIPFMSLLLPQDHQYILNSRTFVEKRTWKKPQGSIHFAPDLKARLVIYIEPAQETCSNTS